MAGVSVQQVTRAFGPLLALDRVSIDFADGGFYALLGPSGSGKTTLLRLIAGFDFPDSGHITIADQPVERVPVEKREIGMMFQNYALFPNMSVFDNIAFGLAVRRVARDEVRRRVGEALDLVRLEGLDKRRPHQLSGGQRQRVALARAIVTRPRVLLLDEPLSALDKALRVEMQVELKRIQRDVAITTIFVTHDQEEALTLSDRIGILRDGQLVQEGTPHAVYERPDSVFIARFLGDANILQAGAARHALRPEKIRIAPIGTAGDDGRDGCDGRVLQHIFAGSSLTYLVAAEGQQIKVFVQNLSGEVLPADTAVRLSWRPEDKIEVNP